MSSIYFNHSGNMGDILYSLYFCKEFIESRDLENPRFNIRYGNHALLGNSRMTGQAAEFIKPLIEATGIFSEVTLTNFTPPNSFDLDIFRKLKIEYGRGGCIWHWYYQLVPDVLPKAVWKPLLKLPKQDSIYNDKIILCLTERERPRLPLDLKALSKFRERLVFLGIPREHQQVCNLLGCIPRVTVNTLLEAAQLMFDAKGIVSNQNGMYSLAEILKVPRILMASGGSRNNFPLGGWCECVERTDNLINAMNSLCLR